jgi:hypothetical protein
MDGLGESSRLSVQEIAHSDDTDIAITTLPKCVKQGCSRRLAFSICADVLLNSWAAAAYNLNSPESYPRSIPAVLTRGGCQQEVRSHLQASAQTRLLVPHQETYPSAGCRGHVLLPCLPGLPAVSQRTSATCEETRMHCSCLPAAAATGSVCPGPYWRMRCCSS